MPVINLQETIADCRAKPWSGSWLLESEVMIHGIPCNHTATGGRILPANANFLTNNS